MYISLLENWGTCYYFQKQEKCPNERFTVCLELFIVKGEKANQELHATNTIRACKNAEAVEY